MDRDDRLIAYIQDRMEPTQRAAFEAELAQNHDLKAELTVMLAARKAMDRTQSSQDTSDGWSLLHGEIIAGEKQSANQNNAPWMKLAQAAGVAVVAVGLWELVTAPWIEPRLSSQDYATASEIAAGPTLQVALVPTAALIDITALLQDLNGTIIDGPGALGIYRIAFLNKGDRDVARTALEANDALVETVFLE